MRYWVVTWFIFSTSLLVRAMTYVPIPLESQLINSKGVVEAEYYAKDYKQTKDGDVLTVLTFKVDKFVGLRRNEILNQNYFQVLVPGGVWQNEVYSVPGVSKFSKGEKVVLIVNKGEQGFVLHNQAMGKYQIIEKEGRKYLKSSVFPQHAKLGEIDYKHFQEKVLEVFKKDFISFHDGKKIYLADNNGNTYAKDSKKRGPARMVASIHEEETERTGNNNSISIFWLAVVLAVLGICLAGCRTRKK